MVGTFVLVVFEWGEFGDGGGFGFVEDGAAAVLELLPAGPLEVWGVGDLAEEATPFDDDSVDIAFTEQRGDPAGFMGGVVVDIGDDLFGSGSVFGGDAIFEVTGDGGEFIAFVAGEGEATGPAVFVTTEAEAGVEVSEVVDEVVEVIGFVFEACGDGESVALVEEADEVAAEGGVALGCDEAESAPGEGGSCGGGELDAGGVEVAGLAVVVVDFAGLGVPEGGIGLVDGDADFELVEVESSGDVVGVGSEVGDGGILFGELFFEEGLDLGVPGGEGDGAAVPVSEFTDPFGEAYEMIGEDIGDGDGAAVGGGAAVLDLDGGEGAGAGFFERWWVGECRGEGGG